MSLDAFAAGVVGAYSVLLLVIAILAAVRELWASFFASAMLCALFSGLCAVDVYWLFT